MIEITNEGWWVIKEDEIHATSNVRRSKRLDFDREFLDILLPYVKPGSIVIDAGANIGSHSFAYSKMGAEVHAFEPNPEAFECLKKNCPGIKSYNIALGDAEKIVSEWIPSSDSGQAFINLPGNLGQPHDSMRSEVESKMITLDSVYKTQRKNFQDLGMSLLKIDVEGCEPLVLRGSVEVISDLSPVLVIEMCFNTLARLGFQREDIISTIDSLNYRAYVLPLDSPFKNDIHFSYNLLAVPKR